MGKQSRRTRGGNHGLALPVLVPELGWDWFYWSPTEVNKDGEDLKTCLDTYERRSGVTGGGSGGREWRVTNW